MPASQRSDPLDALAPSARRAAPRTRIAVGAAVVVFLACVAIAAAMSFSSAGGGDQGVVTGFEATDAADTAHGERSSVAAAPLLVHVLGADRRNRTRRARLGAPRGRCGRGGGRIHGGGRPRGSEPRSPRRRRRAVGRARDRGGAATGERWNGRIRGGRRRAIHLNTADVAALDTLPRIGPALAQRIIDWREANGPFTSVDQLLDVAGIGDAVFLGLADKVAL